MNDSLKRIGIIFADETEFLPFKENMKKKYELSETKKRGREAFVIFVPKGEKTIELHCVQSGIGKVNAASAASFLIADDNVDLMFNLGFAGAVHSLSRGMTVVGSSYCEADFDLTPLGYLPGQKSRNSDRIIKADEELVQLVCRIPYVIPARIGTGDFFLNSTSIKNKIYDEFKIECFDMEGAAIAAVCCDQAVPFAAIRKISDDADDNAGENYKDMANSFDVSLSETMKEIVEII